MRLEEAVRDSLGPGLKELDSVWEYIGYGDEARSQKLQTLADGLQRCLCDFIAAENQHRVDLESRVESLKRKAAQVCQSLRLPPYFPPRGLPTLQLLARLEEHVAQYEVEISARQGRFAQLSDSIGRLCSQLGLDRGSEAADLPEPRPRLDEFIPNEADLDKMSRRLAQLESRRDELMKLFVEFCEDIRRIAADIEYLPESGQEAAVLRPQTSSESPPAEWPLTQTSLAELQAWRLRLVKHKAMLVGTCEELRGQVACLRRRLRLPEQEGEQFLARHRGYRPSDLSALRSELARCQELRCGPLCRTYAASLRSEAAELRAICFEEAPPADASNADDETALESLVDQLRDRYESSRELFDSVLQYQRTWEAYMEVEQRMKDPAIFSNRGGILLKTEKEKKQLMKELPRVEARVTEQLRSCPGGDTFRIRGLTFEQYVQQLWREFTGEREAARQQRRLQGRASIVASVSAHDLSSAGGGLYHQSQQHHLPQHQPVSPRKSMAPPGAAWAAAAAAVSKR